MVYTSGQSTGLGPERPGFKSHNHGNLLGDLEPVTLSQVNWLDRIVVGIKWKSSNSIEEAQNKNALDKHIKCTCAAY